MSLLDNEAMRSDARESISTEQLESIKDTLDSLKLMAILATLPGIYSVVTVFKMMIHGFFSLDMLFFLVLACSYVVAGVMMLQAGRALTSFSYNKNPSDFTTAMAMLKNTWYAWSVWGAIATFYAIKTLPLLF